MSRYSLPVWVSDIPWHTEEWRHLLRKSGDGNRGAFHCAIEFPSISTEGLERVELELYQYYRKFNRDQCFLDYRIDGGAWHAYEINVRDVDVNVNDVLCGKVSYILPSAVTNQSNVQFRLRWYCNSNAGGAYGYIWAVDDVKIKNVNIFPVTVASGQTLYFRQTKFTAPFEAEVINPVLNNIDSSWSPEGSLTVPSMVSYQGVESSSFSLIGRITLQGLPNAITLAGMSAVTTEPEPITECSPMVTPGIILTPAPTHASLQMRIGLM